MLAVYSLKTEQIFTWSLKCFQWYDYMFCKGVLNYQSEFWGKGGYGSMI